MTHKATPVPAFIVAATIAAVATLLAVKAGQGDSDTGPVLVTTTAPDPTRHILADCEDADAIQGPCVTWDKNTWRIIQSYSPYRALTVPQCRAEDGGPDLPCVWRDRHADGGWLVFTGPEGLPA